MKIQLIHPPADELYKKGEAAYLTAPPIGLEIIARAIEIEIENPNAQVEIFDGNLFALDEIKQKLDADIVGVSDWYSKQRNAIEILKTAKEKDSACVTVMGGPNTAYLAERILANQHFVDYVVVGDGEEAMPKIVQGTEPERIPNLYYRKKNGNIEFTFYKKAALDIIFNLEHLVRKDYIYDQQKPFPLSMIRGCIKAAKNKRCTFCALPYKGLKVMQPEVAWKQIRLLKERYNINYFFETGDTFLVGNYPAKLLTARPSGLKEVKFRIYASPEQITPSNITILESLGVQEIFLGSENADETILQKAGKFHRIEDVLNTLFFSKFSRIRSQLSFLYGLPGETEGTARATFELAKSLVEEYPMVFAILTGFALPLIGTELFQRLKAIPGIKNKYQGNLEKDDIFDYEQLVRLQIEHLTECSFETLQGYIDKTSALCPRVGGFGLTR